MSADLAFVAAAYAIVWGALAAYVLTLRVRR